MEGQPVTNQFDAGQPMPLGKILFSFTGRIGRATFWSVWLSMFALNLILGFAFHSMSEENLELGLALLSLLFLGWVSLAIQAKRWHDRGKSAKMILINFIPIFGLIWTMAELGFLRGTIGSNQYGGDPLGSPCRAQS